MEFGTSSYSYNKYTSIKTVNKKRVMVYDTNYLQRLSTICKQKVLNTIEDQKTTHLTHAFLDIKPVFLDTNKYTTLYESMKHKNISKEYIYFLREFSSSVLNFDKKSFIMLCSTPD